MRALTAPWLCALAVLGARTTGAATATDTRLANFAFASELGSGIYEVGGRTIQVYQLQASYKLRPTSPHTAPPGIRLVLPVTVGFFNFQPGDLVHLHLPTSIGAMSVEPGVEFDYQLHDDWHVIPYAKAGGTFASSTQLNAALYGVGIRSDYHFGAAGGAGLWRVDLTHVGVRYHGALPNDSFTRLRDGLELRRDFAWPSRRRAAQLGPYAVTDLYFDAPTGPGSGISARTVQFEAGFMLGADPMWEIHGFALPRIGVGYRVAGVLSGWRLVIGDPF
jgi:hypothetical protein